MANKHEQGRIRDIKRRGIPPDTMITTDTYGLLLTQNSLIDISNHVSALIGRKLTTGDVDMLTKYCSQIREGKYYNLIYTRAQKQIAVDFVNRQKTADAT